MLAKYIIMAKRFRTRRRKIHRSFTKKHRKYSRNRRGAGANRRTGFTPQVLNYLRGYIVQKERENIYTSDKIDWLNSNIDRLEYDPITYGENPIEQGIARINEYLEEGIKW